jgi:hypothetical protein
LIVILLQNKIIIALILLKKINPIHQKYHNKIIYQKILKITNNKKMNKIIMMKIKKKKRNKKLNSIINNYNKNWKI